MPATVFDGKGFAKSLEAALKSRVDALKRPPKAAVFYGSNVPEVVSYVKSKVNRAKNIGVDLALEDVAGADPGSFLRLVQNAADDAAIDAIIVEQPLPFAVDKEALFALIPATKDADGFHPANLGRVFAGQPGIAPATPTAVIRILEATGVNLRGMETVVIGRSLIVGRPLAALLIARDATVTICHTKTKNVADHARGADLLIAAAGKPRVVGAAMVKPGAVVIDVGVDYVDGKMVGDVDFDAVKEVASFITPVPGGVGPVTAVALLENIITLAGRRG